MTEPAANEPAVNKILLDFLKAAFQELMTHLIQCFKELLQSAWDSSSKVCTPRGQTRYGPLNSEERDRRQANNLCYYCGGDHYLKDCPVRLRKSLASVTRPSPGPKTTSVQKSVPPSRPAARKPPAIKPATSKSTRTKSKKKLFMDNDEYYDSAYPAPSRAELTDAIHPDSVFPDIMDPPMPMEHEPSVTMDNNCPEPMQIGAAVATRIATPITLSKQPVKSLPPDCTYTSNGAIIRKKDLKVYEEALATRKATQRSKGNTTPIIHSQRDLPLPMPFKVDRHHHGGTNRRTGFIGSTKVIPYRAAGKDFIPFDLSSSDEFTEGEMGEDRIQATETPYTYYGTLFGTLVTPIPPDYLHPSSKDVDNPGPAPSKSTQEVESRGLKVPITKTPDAETPTPVCTKVPTTEMSAAETPALAYAKVPITERPTIETVASAEVPIAEMPTADSPALTCSMVPDAEKPAADTPALNGFKVPTAEMPAAGSPDSAVAKVPATEIPVPILAKVPTADPLNHVEASATKMPHAMDTATGSTQTETAETPTNYACIMSTISIFVDQIATVTRTVKELQANQVSLQNLVLDACASSVPSLMYPETVMTGNSTTHLCQTADSRRTPGVTKVDSPIPHSPWIKTSCSLAPHPSPVVTSPRCSFSDVGSIPEFQRLCLTHVPGDTESQTVLSNQESSGEERSGSLVYLAQNQKTTKTKSRRRQRKTRAQAGSANS